MALSKIHEARLKARQGMIMALDNFLEDKVSKEEFNEIIDDYESLVNKILEEDVDATVYDNYEVI